MSELLLERYREAKASGAARSERGRLYRDWFAARCREGKPPDALRRDSLNPEERFWATVVPGLNGCLIWDGEMYQNVPRMPIRGSSRTVRRFALERTGIRVPSHRRVVAACGNSRCVAVAHLKIEEHHWTRKWTDEKMLDRLRVVALQLGHAPTSLEWLRGGYKPVHAHYEERFGSWRGAVSRAGLQFDPPRCRNGHLKVGDNVIHSKDGSLRCRACIEESRRRKEERARS